MKLTPDIVVADRYRLMDCLGAGSMGEVWRAQDTRFESRFVAVKFLREDESLKEDCVSRERLVTRLEQHAARGELNAQVALESIVAALSPSDMENLRAKFHACLGQVSPIAPATVLGIFDELVNDPVCNENARMRAKLRRLFRDEANSVANLRHDNIVSIFDYGDHEGNPYLVMDYIEGRTLYQVIQAKDALSRPRRLRLMEDLCAGLGYAHRKKLVHRDIKPANLIIDSSTDSLKILDFGVVRRLGSSSTIGVPVGTFCYMSPEQTRGLATLDHRSDIFAVGLVFYELLSGRKAFPPGRSLGDLVSRIQRDPPAPLRELVPSIQESIEEIIRKALEKLPDNRYQDLAAMERDIARVRARFEAEEVSGRTAVVAKPDDATILRARPAQPSVDELYKEAEREFANGHHSLAADRCRRILARQPSFAAASRLLEQTVQRERELRIHDTIQQAEKFLSLEDLESAKATLARARAIDAAAAAVTAFADKLERALQTREADRLRRQREQEPPALPAADNDTIVVTRVLPRAPAPRPPQMGTPAPEKPPPAAPPRPSARPPASAPDIQQRLAALRPPGEPPASPPPPVAPGAAEIPAAAAAPIAGGGLSGGTPSPASDRHAGAASPPDPKSGAAAVSVASAPAAGRPRPSNRRIIAASIVLASVLAAAAGTYLLTGNRSESPAEPAAPVVDAQPVQPDTEPEPPPIRVEETTPIEPAAAPNTTSVQIDVRPWARVRIVPIADGVTVPEEPLYAPFTIDLPPGEYTLECENGGVTRAATFKLTVAEGKPQFFGRTMPGFNATKTADALLAVEK